MLKKSSELLKAFIEYERQVLAGIDMPYMPTLGAGYEAITRDGLSEDYVIPQGLNLKVVSGFITVRGKIIKSQIDCMLVCGEGKRYGRTEEYLYEIEDVLCVFEVKKTLSKSDLTDAISHLATIRSAFSEHFEYKIEHEKYIPDIESARYNFSKITGKEAPSHYYEINHLPVEEAMIFYTLVQESIAPITIIHGYDGHKTELGLRNAFADILEAGYKAGLQGYGVPAIPSLITANENCLIKTAGMPFVVMNEKSEWVAWVSSRFNSIEMILEVVWTKISNYFKIDMPWNDGLYMNNLAPMLIATPKSEGERAGWLYRSEDFNAKKLTRNDDKLWEPVRLTISQLSIFRLMSAFGGEFEISDENIDYFRNQYSVDLREEVVNMTKTHLFMNGGGCIKPISNITMVLVLDSGDVFAASDEERFNIWCDTNGYEKSFMRLICM